MEKSERTTEQLRAAFDKSLFYFDRSETFGLEAIESLVCPALDSTLSELCTQIEARHEIAASENAEQVTVIHYTSIAALISMLQDARSRDQTSHLRLYDSVHLNDPEEGTHLPKDLTSRYPWLDRDDLPHAYMSSFIMPDEPDSSDDLRYWCAYGDDGQGCSLSISCPRNRLRRVLYGPQELRQTVETLQPALDSVVQMTKNLKRHLRRKVRITLADTVWQSLERVRYLYKDKAYHYENECRFVVPESSLVSEADKERIYIEYQHRNDLSSRIRHYYKDDDLQVTEKILTSHTLITLGPCVPYRNNVRNCIEELKRRSGLFGPKVIFSKIPYRRR